MMLAYPIAEIKALRHQVKAKAWLKSGILSEEEYQKIRSQHPCGLYRPKLAFQILFFIAAIIAVQGAMGLFGLAFIQPFEESLFIPLWFMGFGLFVFAEFLFVREKKHFRSGLLQGLYYAGILYIMAGFYFFTNDIEGPFYLMSGILLALVGIRYLDRFASMCSLLFLNVFFFTLFEGMEGNSKFLLPVVLSGLNAGVFLLISNLEKLDFVLPWKELIVLLKNIALLICYFALNLLVVDSAAHEFLGMTGELPFKGLFITTTLLLPLIYIFLGIRQRNRMFFRLGLVCFALGIATIKYYYSTGHTEFTLTAAGLIVFASAIWLIRKFKTAFKGFTSEKVEGKGSTLLTVLMATQAHQKGDVEVSQEIMGGGKFGGGGAGGKF